MGERDADSLDLDTEQLTVRNIRDLGGANEGHGYVRPVNSFCSIARTSSCLISSNSFGN